MYYRKEFLTLFFKSFKISFLLWFLFPGGIVLWGQTPFCMEADCQRSGFFNSWLVLQEDATSGWTFPCSGGLARHATAEAALSEWLSVLGVHGQGDVFIRITLWWTPLLHGRGYLSPALFIYPDFLFFLCYTRYYNTIVILLTSDNKVMTLLTSE